MRPVAVLLTLATLLATAPLVAGAPTDDCRAPGPQTCREVDLTNSHGGLPGLNGLAYFDVFYIWVSPQHCTSNPVANACNGDASGSDGVVLPDGSGTVPTAGLFGILYQETNGAAGLQRLRVVSGGHLYMPDRMVLL